MGHRDRAHKQEATAGPPAKTAEEQDIFWPAAHTLGTQRLGGERGVAQWGKALVCHTNKHVEGKTERF